MVSLVGTESFEGCELSILQVKSFFLHTLLDWSVAYPSVPYFTLLDMFEHYNLRI